MIVKKIVSLGMIIVLFWGPVMGADTGQGVKKNTDPVPYQYDEFPPWLHEVNRSKTILLGAIPIAALLANISYSIYKSTLDTPPDTTREVQDRLILTLTIAGGIMLTDFILGLIFQDEANEKENPYIGE